ncbi:hypothetical protein SOVF_092530, partial [Spinacia oleracea]
VLVHPGVEVTAIIVNDANDHPLPQPRAVASLRVVVWEAVPQLGPPTPLLAHHLHSSLPLPVQLGEDLGDEDVLMMTKGVCLP